MWECKMYLFQNVYKFFLKYSFTLFKFEIFEILNKWFYFDIIYQRKKVCYTGYSNHAIHKEIYIRVLLPAQLNHPEQPRK